MQDEDDVDRVQSSSSSSDISLEPFEPINSDDQRRHHDRHHHHQQQQQRSNSVYSFDSMVNWQFTYPGQFFNHFAIISASSSTSSLSFAAEDQFVDDIVLTAETNTYTYGLPWLWRISRLNFRWSRPFGYHL